MAQRKTEIIIARVDTGRVTACIKGTQPLICNRMSQKAKRGLIQPRQAMSRAEKGHTRKHDVYEEFRESPVVLPAGAPTLLAVPAPAFKGALRGAALRTPGGNKTEIGQMTWIAGYDVPVYGIPQLFMSVVRNSDIARTPDVRTRAILPRWACQVEISFVQPMLNETTVLTLLSNAGVLMGIGDYRQEKGAGNFGAFELTNPDDADYLDILATGAREAQLQALTDPEPFNEETEDLLKWYEAEIERRGFSAEPQGS